MKKNYMHTIYEWRDAVREAANIAVSHKFLQQNVRNFMYLQPDVMERFAQEHPLPLLISERLPVQGNPLQDM